MLVLWLDVEGYMIKRDKTDSPHNNIVAVIAIVVMAIGIAATLWVIANTPQQVDEAPAAPPPVEAEAQ